MKIYITDIILVDIYWTKKNTLEKALWSMIIALNMICNDVLVYKNKEYPTQSLLHCHIKSICFHRTVSYLLAEISAT